MRRSAALLLFALPVGLGSAFAAAPPASALAPSPSGTVLVAGQTQTLEAAAALQAGYTLIDLTNDWTPFIFEEMKDANGAPLPNRYRSVYLGLANDTGDGDGQPLSPGEHNYLELYGIEPTFAVLRARFLDDEAHQSCKDIDYDKLKAANSIPLRNPQAEARMASKIRAERRGLETKRRRAHLSTLDALAAADPQSAKLVAEVERYAAERLAFPVAEKRLACEHLFPAHEKHARGKFDEAMREAVIRFQHKEKLYDSPSLRPSTMDALARTPLENDYQAFVRVLTERVVSGADILEDGTVDTRKGPPTYESASGARLPVRNLVDEMVQATLKQLGIDGPEAALAFFKSHPAEDFKSLTIAVKLPALPEYYSPDMDLSVVVDRGDVIYDPLFDENGKPTKQTRHHFPSLTLYTKYRGQRIPLVRWRTTIGGWRSELASNGYEYYRYKGSDIGPRVWRNIVSGPVWIAPNSTPLHTLVKSKLVRRRRELVVNYDEVGPGYLSAYGLVAAYNVVPGKDGRPDWDNGIRVHGSSEILSIRNPDAYSHGCHRLMNHLAERLFSFVLRHRPMVVEGDKPLGFSRQFLWKDDVYEMRLPSRGYWYRLEPPVPINVLEGNIIGDTKKPITGYIPKPG
ncbi:MAG: L,D-transpeptidase, partial [Polyangia bacterium]